MKWAQVIDNPDAGRVLVIHEDDDEHGGHVREIPLGAIAVRRELLGIDDPAEVLDAIIYLQDHGEPDADPVTGRNAWTELFQLLQIREEAREAEAALAREQRCTESEIARRAERAAYDAVHQPIKGGECALDRCRREARAQLGIPDPDKKCGAETRTTPPPLRPSARLAVSSSSPDAGDLLSGESEYLLTCTKRFLHSLTDQDADPLEAEQDAEPEPMPQAATPEETLAKYQEAARE